MSFSPQHNSPTESNTTDKVCTIGTCTNYEVGDTVLFGNYFQSNAENKEPIQWQILEIDSVNRKMLLLSMYVIDVKPYHAEYDGSTDITWEKCTIRSWLNGYDESYNKLGNNYTGNNFINTAFTATERTKIVSSIVPAHANPNYCHKTSPGNATTDKIFLLSITEANNYFSSEDERKAEATRYAVEQGVYIYSSTLGQSDARARKRTCADFHYYVDWWLRSPGRNAVYAALVIGNGSVNCYGMTARRCFIGVRPALWVKY